MAIRKNKFCDKCKFFVPVGAKPDGHCLLHKTIVSRTNECAKYEDKPKAETKTVTQILMNKLKGE